MRKIIYSLPEQIEESISLFDSAWNNVGYKSFFHKRFEKVLICGMGGSGISGDIVSALYPEINIIVNKDYQIPAYVDKKTLGILVSYSGNTEETLHNFSILKKRGVSIAMISSDGKLMKEKAFLKIRIPQGFPPRGALGYLFTPIPFLLYHTGLLARNPKMELAKMALFLKKQAKSIEKKGRLLAKMFVGKIPIIYANSNAFAVVAKRWQCQLNENSKVLCHINIIPEMNHNEVVGIGRPKSLNKDLMILFLNDPDAFVRNKLRVRIIKEIINKEIKGLKFTEINPLGRNPLERVFSTIMLGDFLSLYLAQRTGIDPMPVRRIDYLKNRLSDSG
ncbi:MAG: bifunctional phosphoglucose/phosphomannose isomerase [candidate division WOR-3 bacterium]